MPKTVLTNRLREAIDSRYAAGERVRDICNDLKVKRQTISSYLHRTEQSRPVNEWKGKELETLKIMYLEGECYKYIANKLGHTVTSVSRRISLLIRTGELQCRSRHGMRTRQRHI